VIASFVCELRPLVLASVRSTRLRPRSSHLRRAALACETSRLSTCRAMLLLSSSAALLLLGVPAALAGSFSSANVKCV